MLQIKYTKLKSFFSMWVLLLLSAAAMAQPANDDPCNALPLTVGATCNYINTTNLGATATTGVTAPGCANYLGGDVWYSFVVPAGGAVVVDCIQGSLTDGGMAIYSGAVCTSLTLIECDDDDSDNGLMPSITRTGLTPGSTIYVRVWEYGNDNLGTFGICVTLLPPAPANDECSAAVNLTVNPNLSCAAITQGTTVAATPSTGQTNPTCSPTGANDDVWYSFTATNTTHVISITNISGSSDMIMQVYSGACGSLVAVQCSDPEYMTVNSLTVGQAYIVRVYTWSSSAGTRSTFNICVGTLPPPPTNDNCSAAAALTVNADLNCGVVTAGSTVSTTPSTGVPTPSCAAAGVGDDVWYSFVATNNTHRIELRNVTGPVTDMVFAVYSGSCAGLTQLICSDPNANSVSGLTVGVTYFVRVWTYTSTVGSYANFNICIGTPPPPPAFDETCNAILLTPTYTCNYVTYSNASATASAGVPAPGCASYQGGDVWFKAVVPCEGSLKVNTKQGVITDGGMAFYSGNCGTLTLLECDDDDSENGLMPMITRNNLTAGDTIYIRFWEYGNDNLGSFEICATIPPPPSATSLCASANPFCTSQTYTVPNTTGVPSLGGNGIYGCLGSTPNPAWYYLQVQTAGDIIIGISQTTTGGAGIDVDYAVWGPFTSLATACNGLSAANNISCSFSPDPTETATILNAQPGQYYIILLTNYSDDPGTITFQQVGGTGQSSCATICTITAANSGPICSGGTINLTTPGFANATYVWTGPNCFTSTLQNPTNVTPPLEPGTYTYTLTATSPGGNTCNTTTTVIVRPRPALGEDTTIIKCAGSPLNLTTIFNTTGLTTSWTFNGTAVTTPASVNLAGIYTLIAANANSCVDTATINFKLDTVQSTLASVNQNCSTNGTITVTNVKGIAPYTYNINTQAGVFQASNVYNVPAGNYTITTRDSLGCTTTNTVTVGFTDNLTLSTIANASLCAGQSINLTTTSNATTFSWSPSTGLSASNVASPVATPATTTTYTVTATLGSCTKTASVTINIANAVTANAGPDISVLSGEQATIMGSATGNINNILWTPATGLSSATTLTPTVTATTGGNTTYTLRVQNAQGCFATDDMVVTVIPYCIKIKNAFSPNGDGINEKWQVYDDYACLKNVTVHLFNRYGNKVYESRDYRNSWDGTYKGKPVPDGTYYAVIDFILINGRKFTSRSDVTIIR